jgi:hypothetical protein
MEHTGRQHVRVDDGEPAGAEHERSPSVCFGGGRILRARKWFRPRGLVSPSLRLNFTASPPDILQEGIRRPIRAAREFAALQVAAK